MLHLLFGTWRRRLFMLLICAISFILSLTIALTTAVIRSPACAPAARQFPGLGPMAVALAEWRSGPLAEPPVIIEEDVTTYRQLWPLSAEKLAELIQNMEQQRNTDREKSAEIEKAQKRLALYRAELAEERQQIQTIKEQIDAQWEEILEARAAHQREITELKTVEAKNLQQLATTYAGMKPAAAASTITKLDESTATKILALMNERKAAKVLEELDAEIAAHLTERMILLKREK